MEQESSPAPQPDVTELRAECQWLRRQFFRLLVLMIIVSGTLTVYLWREYRYAHGELTALRAQAGPALANYQKVIGPRMNQFVQAISEYGRTHPDFAPIMKKYGLTNAATAPAPK